MMHIERLEMAAVICAIVWVAGFSDGFASMIPPDKVKLERLPSGLTVAVAEDHSAPVVAVRVVVRAGSIYEQEYSGSGISHFVEHVESDGTARMTKTQIGKFSDEFGGLINAYTTSDHTCYHAVAPSRYFDKVLFLLSHCYTEATFPEKEVETQRGVIESEIAKDLDEPMRVLWRQLMTTMFRRHPIRYATIGTKELFSQLRRDDLFKYYRRMYVPENTIVVVAGDVKQQEALSKAKKAFQHFSARPFAPIVLPAEPRQLQMRSSVVEMDVRLAYLMLGYRTVPLQHPDLYALDVLAAILGNGRSARLVQSIKHKQCLVQDITVTSWTPHFGIGGFFIRAALPADNIDKTVAAVHAQLETLKKAPVPESELNKAKKLIKSDYLLGVETMEQKARLLASDLLATGEVGFSYRYLDGIAAVSADQIMAVAQKYLNQNQLSVVAVVPKGKGESGAKPEDKKKAKVHRIERSTLPNGLRLLTLAGETTSTISIDAYFLAGTRYETPETNGVANLMAQLLLRGTKSRTADELALAIDALGGKVSASSDMNTFHVSLEVLQDDLEESLGIVADIILHPRFDEEDFKRQQKNALAIIERQADYWFEKPRQVMLSNLYRAHPYRMSKYGTLKNVAKLTVDDVWDYYEAYVKPDNLVLAVFGVVSNEYASSLVKKYFSEFSGQTIRPKIALDPPLSENVEVTEMTGWKQAAVFYGFRSCAVSDDDKYAFDVLDAVLSGAYSPGGRLHARLRNAKLVYLVHAYNRLGVDPGWFSVYASCLPKNLKRVRKAIAEEIIRTVKEPVGDEELRIAKGMCIADEQVHRLQTSSQQAAAACLGELYGLGYDSFLEYGKKIDAVTAADVLSVARKYFTHYVQVTGIPRSDSRKH